MYIYIYWNESFLQERTGFTENAFTSVSVLWLEIAPWEEREPCIGKHLYRKKQGGPVGSVGSRSWTRGSHRTSGYLHHKALFSSGMMLLLCFLLFGVFLRKTWQVLFRPYFHPNSNHGNLCSLKTFIWQENGFLPSCERRHCNVRKIMKC